MQLQCSLSPFLWGMHKTDRTALQRACDGR